MSAITVKAESGRYDLLVNGVVIGAVYQLYCSNRTGSNLVLFKKDRNQFDSLSSAVKFAENACVLFFMDWFNNYLSVECMAYDHGMTVPDCIQAIELTRIVFNHGKGE